MPYQGIFLTARKMSCDLHLCNRSSVSLTELISPVNPKLWNQSRIVRVKLSEIPEYLNVLYPQVLLLSSSKCKGFTSISEDSSEISFLLVENYNYDHSLWSSDRMGIFGQRVDLSFFDRTLHLFITGRPSWVAVKKRLIVSAWQQRRKIGLGPTSRR